MPLTTVSPEDPSSRPSSRATSSPYADARREPTMVTLLAAKDTQRLHIAAAVEHLRRAVVELGQLPWVQAVAAAHRPDLRDHASPRRRSASASLTWSARTGSLSSRSAIVLARRRVRSQPRPLMRSAE